MPGRSLENALREKKSETKTEERKQCAAKKKVERSSNRRKGSYSEVACHGKVGNGFAGRNIHAIFPD